MTLFSLPRIYRIFFFKKGLFMQTDTSSILPDDASVEPHSRLAATDEAAPARQDKASTEHRLRFTGTGSEYFRIWIVNLLLSILTFGIYSAWAKVRREQYFHRNTLLDGSGFDYHGEPKAIFKGRIIAVTFMSILALVDKLAPHLYFPVVLIASPLIPWLMIRSLVFRSRNTSFRGLHFDFHGTYKGFCKAYLVPLLVLIALVGAAAYTIGKIKAKMYTDISIRDELVYLYMSFMVLLGVFLLLLIPVLPYYFKAFQFNHLAFGTSRFESRFRLRSFYWLYLRVFVLLPLLVVLVLVVLFILAKNISADDAYTATVVPLMYIGLLIGSQAWFAVLQSNLIWNKIRLDKHSFRSDQTFWSFFRVLVGNLLLMILTLGLYWPWARVKIARYRAEHTAVLAAGSLDDFIAGATREKSAIGEEIADIFDFDFGF